MVLFLVMIMHRNLTNILGGTAEIVLRYACLCGNMQRPRNGLMHSLPVSNACTCIPGDSIVVPFGIVFLARAKKELRLNLQVASYSSQSPYFGYPWLYHPKHIVGLPRRDTV